MIGLFHSTPQRSIAPYLSDRVDAYPVFAGQVGERSLAARHAPDPSNSVLCQLRMSAASVDRGRDSFEMSVPADAITLSAEMIDMPPSGDRADVQQVGFDVSAYLLCDAVDAAVAPNVAIARSMAFGDPAWSLVSTILDLIGKAACAMTVQISRLREGLAATAGAQLRLDLIHQESVAGRP